MTEPRDERAPRASSAKPETPAETTAPAQPASRAGGDAPAVRSKRRMGLPKLRKPRAKYPHGIHPAVVPGVAADDNEAVKYRIDWWVLAPTCVLIVAFVIWGVVSPESMATASDAGLAWVTSTFGWLFIILAAVVLVYMVWIGLSRYGRIPLGRDGEKPEFSFLSWLGMMFAAGMGIGLLFFGPYEPLNYFLHDLPPGLHLEPGTVETMHAALGQTAFHWGFQAWAMYALVGCAVAYSTFRRGRPAKISSIFDPLFGRIRAKDPIGRVIDFFAIVVTLFGTSASLGIGAMQIGTGVEIVAGIGPVGNGVLIAIIAVLTVCFITSAVSGVSKGIKYLSNINMALAAALAVFVFVVGPTLFFLNFIPAAFGSYFENMLHMLGRTASSGPEAADFVNTWTVFYWAWWVSWTPFVGTFIARISRGRSIRQFVFATILVPSTVCISWFAIFGGYSMRLEMEQPGEQIFNSQPERILFNVLDHLPAGTGFVSILVLVMLAIFFVTSADSASIVASSLAQNGNPNPKRAVTVALGLLMPGIAIVMMLSGGENGLMGLQNLITISALPFAFIVALMMVALYRDLRTDPMSLRYAYTQAALKQAVHEGIDRYGDDFKLQVAEAGANEWSAGSWIDSEAGEYTDWYRSADREALKRDLDAAIDVPPASIADVGRELPAGEGRDAPSSAASRTADQGAPGAAGVGRSEGGESASGRTP